MRTPSTIREDMLAAFASRDSRALEDAVYAAFEADLPSELAELLADALDLTWHFRHEDIAVALRRMKSPRTIGALAKAAEARHPYLDADETRSLARRCVAALSEIEHPSATAALERLAQSDDVAIATIARRRLDAARRSGNLQRQR